MPLQLIRIFTFIFLLLPPTFSIALVSKPGCEDRCGDLLISYPFGIGSNCSLDPSFTINCNSSTIPPKPYLSVIQQELIEINETYIRVKYPNLVSVCYDLSGGTGMNVTAESYKKSIYVDLSRTPYTLSYWNRLSAIGCDDMVLQSNGSWVSGGCSAFCAEKNDAGGVGYCPHNATSLGNGCCQARIFGEKGYKKAIGARKVEKGWNEKDSCGRSTARTVRFYTHGPCVYSVLVGVGDINRTDRATPCARTVRLSAESRDFPYLRDFHSNSTSDSS